MTAKVVPGDASERFASTLPQLVGFPANISATSSKACNGEDKT
jgi:hypothetical protein